MISILANIWAGNSAPCPDCPTCPDCTGEPFTLNPSAANPLDLLGLFTYGDLIDRDGNVYAGELILNATVCVPGYDIENTTGLTAIRAPNLVAIDPNDIQDGAIYIYGNSAITSIEFPNLMILGRNFHCDICSSLTSVDLGNLEIIGYDFVLRNCPLLTTISLPSAISIGGSLACQNNALTSSTVNGLLSFLVSANGGTWNQTASLNGQIPAAPPTGQGIIDKATLIGRGATVNTD